MVKHLAILAYQFIIHAASATTYYRASEYFSQQQDIIVIIIHLFPHLSPLSNHDSHPFNDFDHPCHCPLSWRWQQEALETIDVVNKEWKVYKY